MKTIILITLINFYSVSLFALGEGGGMDSGGADTYRAWNGSAWFVPNKHYPDESNRAPNICIIRSEDFFLSEADLKRKINSTYKKWETYYLATKHSLNNLNFSINILDSCNKSADITFYFGAIDDRVKKIKQKFNNPVAFTYREKYFPVKGESKGLLWFAKSGSVDPVENYPNWGDIKNFEIILTHEIGHILGNLHREGTIMDPNIAGMITNSELRKHYSKKIDGKSLLATRIGGNYNIPASKNAFHNEYIIQSLKSFFNFKELNHTDVRLHLNNTFPQGSFPDELKLLLKNKEKELEINLDWTRSYQTKVERNRPFFEYVQSNKNDPTSSSQTGSLNLHRYYTGTFDYGAKTYNFVLEMNMGINPVRLIVFLNGVTKTFFVGKSF